LKSIGIFICNYNKREFVVNCVKSLLEQSFCDFDLFVVDNASTDDSVEKLREEYGDKITIIENDENLGGSGGFNTGIRRGYNDGYKYIMLVDNDTVFDKEAVGELYKFLEENSDVGMAGSKVYYMQNPSTIQDFGAKLLWDNYQLCGINVGEKDKASLPNIQEADYLAACSLMVRRGVIDKIGFMNESCFIYWDDAEWGHKARLAGYRCCAVGSSKVWHNSSAGLSSNLGFSRYYFLRNRLNFFARYIKEEDIETFAKVMLSEVYKNLVGFYCKKQFDMLPIIMYALDDFLHDVRGKAPKFKIDRSLDSDMPCEELIKNNSNVLIKVDKQHIDINNNFFPIFIDKCLALNPELKIAILPKGFNNEELKMFEQYGEIKNEEPTDCDLIFYFCNHISDEKKCKLPEICVDVYLNCICDEDIYRIYAGIESNTKLFINSYIKMFIDQVKTLRTNN